MTDTPSDDFLDGAAFAEPDATDEISHGPDRRRRLPAAAVTAAWLVLGLVLGAVGVAAWHSSNGNAATRLNPAANGFAPNGQSGAAGGNALPGGQGSGGQGFGGQDPGSQGFGGPGFFGRDGEQHLVGTLTAVSGSTLTVTTTSGSATYTVDASTDLVKDGQRVTSLSAMHAGDTVVLHVYPLNGTTRVERVIDGAPAGSSAPLHT